VSRDHGEAVVRYIEMGYKAIRVQDRRCVESSAWR
jgi:hypothetical protein